MQKEEGTHHEGHAEGLKKTMHQVVYFPPTLNVALFNLDKDVVSSELVDD